MEFGALQACKRYEFNLAKKPIQSFFNILPSDRLLRLIWCRQLNSVITTIFAFWKNKRDLNRLILLIRRLKCLFSSELTNFQIMLSVFCGSFICVFLKYPGKIGYVSYSGFFHDLELGEV